REQTLNQLLVEMDGFGSNDGIIVMAATNRPDILDPALLRPGRFDRQITVNYPDIKGREDILKVHAKNKPLEGEVDLSVVAKSTIGFTGADLANLLNEAALLAARKGKSLIGMNDIEEAFTKVIVGPAKKSKVVSEKERKLTAYHEAGHAIVGYLSDDSESVHQISIIPAGRAGGYTLSLPKEDRSYRSKLDMETDILGLLGGRVAEKLILGDISTGASNDIQRATAIARSMVTKYGMSDTLGPIVYGSDHDGEVFLGRDFSATRDYSEDTAARIDAEIKRIVTEAYDRAMKLLEENVDKLHFVAGFLFKNEVMDGDQFAAAMAGNPTVEELEEMVAEKKRKSEEENAAKAKRDAEEAKRREEEEKERLEEQRRRFDPAAGADNGEVHEDIDNKDE
ncbi:MAG: AAA family ATPase, partial [Clostridia bacterium]|nr:AAA family ATPase [Clostridia bacterium]